MQQKTVGIVTPIVHSVMTAVQIATVGNCIGLQHQLCLLLMLIEMMAASYGHAKSNWSTCQLFYMGARDWSGH